VTTRLLAHLAEVGFVESSRDVASARQIWLNDYEAEHLRWAASDLLPRSRRPAGALAQRSPRSADGPLECGRKQLAPECAAHARHTAGCTRRFAKTTRERSWVGRYQTRGRHALLATSLWRACFGFAISGAPSTTSPTAVVSAQRAYAGRRPSGCFSQRVFPPPPLKPSVGSMCGTYPTRLSETTVPTY